MFRRRPAVIGTAVVMVLVAALMTGCTSSPTRVRPPRTSVTSIAPPSDPLLAAALSGYHRYVDTQVGELVTDTGRFARAVDSGDWARARLLYPTARVHYERTEPAAERWGNLDFHIDGRRTDFVHPAQDFTGFHRVEQLLWARPLVARPGFAALTAARAATRVLVRDVAELNSRVPHVTYTMLQLTSGATELLNEVESKKVTGTEEAYSHLDLLDIAANVDGAAEIVRLIAPYLREHDRPLLATIDQRIAEVRHVLDGLAQSPGYDHSGWPSYADVTQAQRRDISNVVEALTTEIALTTAATTD